MTSSQECGMPVDKDVLGASWVPPRGAQSVQSLQQARRWGDFAGQGGGSRCQSRLTCLRLATEDGHLRRRSDGRSAPGVGKPSGSGMVFVISACRGKAGKGLGMICNPNQLSSPAACYSDCAPDTSSSSFSKAAISVAQAVIASQSRKSPIGALSALTISFSAKPSFFASSLPWKRAMSRG